MGENLDNRKKPTENKVRFLHGEVNGKCPKCNKVLIIEKNGRYTNMGEIAHIYPCNPLPHEVELLKGQELLHEDVNDLANQIALCTGCHTTFDNPRTLESYIEMVEIKKSILAQKKLEKKRDSIKIEQEINKVLNWLSEYCAADDEAQNRNMEPDYDVKELDKKANETLKFRTKQKIKSNIREFYAHINKELAALDTMHDDVSSEIRVEVKHYYIALKRLGYDQTRIFKEMTNWMMQNSTCECSDTCEIMVSFFVQDCEVFS
ncbi:HNH endonuclease [Vibrio vulnificus]|nr:HNH endonuclease [Vibrio vulnificus]EIU7550599.1 HNH endonuclease [Vibrio vulnificus]EME0907941.1 HNH endonuclease [Vibrio vulnificus]